MSTDDKSNPFFDTPEEAAAAEARAKKSREDYWWLQFAQAAIRLELTDPSKREDGVLRSDALAEGAAIFADDMIGEAKKRGRL